MRFLLDSDSLSDLFNTSAPSYEAILRRLSALEDSDRVLTSILAVYELEYGHANAPTERKAIYNGSTLA